MTTTTRNHAAKTGYPLYAFASQLNRPVSRGQVGLAAVLAASTIAAVVFAAGAGVRADDGKGPKLAAAPKTSVVDGTEVKPDGGVVKKAVKAPKEPKEILPSVAEIEKMIAEDKKEEAIVILQKLRWREPKNRLHPLQRIAPGESVVVPMAPDDGMCVTELSWTVATVCRTVRVTAQANGSMTVQASSQGNVGQPLVSVCCVSGNDRGGNPVTLPVTAATEFTVEVGLVGGFTTTQSVVVKTSFDP